MRDTACPIPQWSSRLANGIGRPSHGAVMSRFVLKRTRGGEALDASGIGALPGIQIVDQVSDAALLVEADADVMQRHQAELQGWTVAPEVRYPLPGPHRVALKR